jgi:NTP pyrophosphatase (non-canonical NTP hydrolase)
VINLKELQGKVGAWSKKNFGEQGGDHGAMVFTLGVNEEAGELAHAILKRTQGIRGTREEHDAAAQDAIGDINVYLMDLCDHEGWDYEAIIRDTAAKVLKRDWTQDKQNGGERP